MKGFPADQPRARAPQGEGLPVVLLLGLGLVAASGLLRAAGAVDLRGGVFAPLALIAAPLDHPTRLRILRHLRMLPGDHFRSIVRHLDLSVGETRHHLHVLHRHGLVRELKGGGRSRYYPRDAESDAGRNELYERHWAYRDLRMRVHRRVCDLGTTSAKEVADGLGISRQLAWYHLQRLVASGHLHRDGSRYRP